MRFWRPKSDPKIRVEITGAYVPTSILREGLKGLFRRGGKRRANFRRRREPGRPVRKALCARCESPLPAGRFLVKRCEACGRVNFLPLRRRPLTIADVLIALVLAILLLLPLILVVYELVD